MGTTQTYGLRTVEDADYLKSAVKDAPNENMELIDEALEAAAFDLAIPNASVVLAEASQEGAGSFEFGFSADEVTVLGEYLKLNDDGLIEVKADCVVLVSAWARLVSPSTYITGERLEIRVKDSAGEVLSSNWNVIPDLGVQSPSISTTEAHSLKRGDTVGASVSAISTGASAVNVKLSAVVLRSTAEICNLVFQKNAGRANKTVANMPRDGRYVRGIGPKLPTTAPTRITEDGSKYYPFLGWSMTAKGSAKYQPGDVVESDDAADDTQLTLYGVWDSARAVTDAQASGGGSSS